MTRPNILSLPMASFARSFSGVLPAFINGIQKDPDILHHPRWQQFIPCPQQRLASKCAAMHRIRPDIVLTDSGPIVTEIDFVPAGIGIGLQGLRGDDALQDAYLQPFAEWYNGHRVSLTGTSRTIKEIELLTTEMARRYPHTRVVGNKIEDGIPAGFDVIDRQFYADDHPFGFLDNAIVTTNRPYHDSKVWFAVIHDRSMDALLLRHVSAGQLAFLRQVLPETHLLGHLQPEELKQLIGDDHTQWLIKGTGVEETGSWGCRSTFLGVSYTRGRFGRILDVAMGISEESPAAVLGNHKHLPRHPVIQRFYASRDFRKEMVAMMQGGLQAVDAEALGKRVDDIDASRVAQKPAAGRLGIYFLVDAEKHSCLHTPAGIITLRSNNALVHGAGDCRMASFVLE